MNEHGNCHLCQIWLTSSAQFSAVYLVESGANDWNQEAVVEVVKELAAHKRVCHLYYSVTEFKTVHEQH